MKNSRAPRRPFYANSVSTAALVLAMAGLVGGGAAVAAENAKAGKPKIGASQIKKNAVKRSKIAPNAVDGRRVADGSLTGSDIANGSIQGTDLAPGLLASAGPGGSTGIPDGSITGAKIADGSLTGVDLANDSLRGAHIVAGSIGTSDLAAGAVGADSIANGAVSGSKVQPNSLGADQINEQTLGTVPTATNALTATTAQRLSSSNFASAVVGGGGALNQARSTGFVTGAQRIDQGKYAVTFNRSLSGRCAFSATVTPSNTVGLTEPVNGGSASVAQFDLSANILRVDTTDGDTGGLVDKDFTLFVICEPQP